MANDKTINGTIPTDRETVFRAAMYNAHQVEEYHLRLDALQVEYDNCLNREEAERVLIVSEICAETDDNGKPLFSNEQARKAEALMREMDSKALKAAKKETAKAYVQLRLQTHKLNTLQTLIKIQRDYLRGFGA